MTDKEVLDLQNKMRGLAHNLRYIAEKIEEKLKQVEDSIKKCSESESTLKDLGDMIGTWVVANQLYEQYSRFVYGNDRRK